VVDSFDRHTRQREYEEIAREEHEGYGPSKRGRMPLGCAIATVLGVLAFVVGAFLVMPGPETQRIEVPEAGLAVEIPVDWTVKSVSDDPGLSILVPVGPEWFGPEVTVASVLVATEPEVPATGIPPACTIVAYSRVGLDSESFTRKIWGGAKEAQIEVLQAGLTRTRLAPLFGGSLHNEHYAVDLGDDMAFVWCFAVAPRYETWRAIAESVEPILVETADA
jgi:hypothetical protein